MQQITNRYKILNKLGQGGMGAVWRVYDRLEQQEVALKQVNISPSKLQFGTKGLYKGERLALANEFKMLASLRHPHIVSVLDYGFNEQKFPYITMSLLENATNFYEAAINLELEQQVQLVIETLLALNYLHRRGILHRDLKPDNVMVVDGQVRVLDFGLAIEATEGFTGFAGTLAYMSPEVLKMQPATLQSDLYAVGVMLYRLVVGAWPFDPDDLTTRLYGNMDFSPLSNHPLALVITRLLQPFPEDRYSHAYQVIEALCRAMDIPVPSENRAIRESYLQANTFVGRDNELNTLQTALKTTLEGGAAFYLVGGESGIGKSRLLDELRTTALVSGASVFRGQSAESGLPFQVWRNIVRRLLLVVDITDLHASILKDIVPDIDTLLGHEVSNAPKLTGRAYQDRMVLTIANLFRKLTTPVVLILEDLQWANESLAVLKQLLLVRDQLHHLMVIGNYRNDEAPSLPDELIGMILMSLDRLSSDEIQTLSTAMLGQAETNEQVMSLLEHETEGNIFFLVETVRALAEDAGSLEQIGNATLPDHVFTGGMQAIARRRLSKVDAKYSDIQTLAAIIGREIDMALLAEAHDEASIDTWLNNAAEYGVVAIQDNIWRFAHDKLRETIIADISDDELPNAHRSAAETIEAVYPDDEDYNEALLGHWQQVSDLDKIYHYTLPVADNMIKIIGAYAAAETLLQSLLELLATDDARRISPLNSLADSVRRHGNYDLAKTHATEAQELATIHDDLHGLATSLHILGIIAHSQGDYEQATNLYKQSLDIRQELGSQSGIAASLNNLGGVAWNLGDYEQATDLYQQSLSIRQQLGDQSGITDSLYNLGVLARIQGDYERAIDLYQQSLAIKQQLGDQYAIGLILNALGIIALHQGDYERAIDLYQQSLAIKQQLGDQSGIAATLHNLGGIAYSQKNYERATDLYQQSLAIKQQLGDQSGIAATLNTLGRIVQEQGQTGHKQFCQSLAIAQDIQATMYILLNIVGFAVYFIGQGHIERAAQFVGLVQPHPAQDSNIREYLEKIMPQLEAALPPDDLHTALEQGKQLDLDTVVQELLEEFGDEA